MIELKFSGMCEGCKCADLAIDKLYMGYMGDEKVWEVRCEHKDACKAMKKKLTKCDEYEVYG